MVLSGGGAAGASSPALPFRGRNDSPILAASSTACGKFMRLRAHVSWILHQALRRINCFREGIVPATPEQTRDKASTKHFTAYSSGQMKSYDLSAVSREKQSQGSTSGNLLWRPVSCPYFSRVTVCKSRVLTFSPKGFGRMFGALMVGRMLGMLGISGRRPPSVPFSSTCHHRSFISTSETATWRTSRVPCRSATFSSVRPLVAACSSRATLASSRLWRRTCLAERCRSRLDLSFRA
mmetsp:Transcript_86252/g.239168  ORF Transcript_86252/g.239168 Transcript_86252/m.239168 type:complete len:237 (+) Transcript_86252:523-1233(+)